MALIPKMYRPGAIIRRKAIRDGFRGGSMLWKLIGVYVFGRSFLSKFFGRRVEVIDTASLGAGRSVELVTMKPITRRQKRKRRKAGLPVHSRAEHIELAQLWASTAASRRSGSR